MSQTPMNPAPGEPTNVDDPIGAWLLEYQNALAVGEQPPAIPPQYQNDDRLIVAKNCIDQLQQMWAVPPATLDWNDESIRQLASGRTPSRIGRFEILRVVGRGGCGIVFLAHDPDLNREVALKVPRPEMLLTPEMRERFLREARAAAILDHPGIVTIHETGEAGALVYFTATYCPGPTLGTWLASRNEVSIAAAARLMLEIAEAVQHAHERGILHRDIKPSNILLLPIAQDASDLNSFKPLISDFGLAKLLEVKSDNTRTGQILGTPTYMSPEQARGDITQITLASDVYSLGVVLYEILTGQPPFSGGTDLDVLRHVVQDDPVPPRRIRSGLPADLEAICLRCLEKSPENRYPSAREFADDLRRYLEGIPTIARPIGSMRRAGRWVCRHKTLTALIALIGFSITGALIGSTLYNAELNDLNNSLAVANQQLIREKEIALERGRELRLTVYADQIRFAMQHLEANDLEQVSQLLDGMRPHADEDDLREFAWHHLQHQNRLQSLTYRGHEGPVYRLAYSPDGRLLAASGKDGTIHLWAPETGQSIGVLRGHDNEVNGILFTLDGRQLLSASDDRTIRVWDLATQSCVRILRGHQAKVFELNWLADRKTFVSADENGVLNWWTMGSDQPLKSRSLPRDTRIGAIDPEGRWVMGATAAGKLFRWDLATDEQMIEVNIPTHARRLTIVPGTGDVIATFHERLIAEIPFVGSPRHLPIELPRISALHVSPDGRFLLLGSLDGTVTVWDRLGQQPMVNLHAHVGRIWDIVFHPDGESFTTCGDDGLVKRWTWETVRRQQTIKLPDHAVAGVFLPDRPWLIVTGYGVPIQAWDYQRRIPVMLPEALHSDDTRPIKKLLFSPLERQLIALDRDRLGLNMYRFHDPAYLDRYHASMLMGSTAAWGHPTIEWSGTFTVPDGELLDMAISNDARLLVASNKQGDIHFYDWRTGKLRETLHVAEQPQQATVALHPRQPVIAFRGQGGEILLWNWIERRYIGRLAGHRFDLSRLAFSPDGELLASAGEDAIITLWNWKSARVIRQFVGHRAGVRHITFSPDGKNLASGADDHTLRIWQVISGHELLSFSNPNAQVRWLGFDPSGRTLVASWGYVGLKECELRFWDTGE